METEAGARRVLNAIRDTGASEDERDAWFERSLTANTAAEVFTD
jgi:hypothetical protein